MIGTERESVRKYRLVTFDFDSTLAGSFPWFVRVVNSGGRAVPLHAHRGGGSVPAARVRHPEDDEAPGRALVKAAAGRADDSKIAGGRRPADPALHGCGRPAAEHVCTDTEVASRFYEAQGFAPVASPHATHRMVLGELGFRFAT